jgi:pimeloyl-ACP methyl ester carboxylesterase
MARENGVEDSRLAFVESDSRTIREMTMTKITRRHAVAAGVGVLAAMNGAPKSIAQTAAPKTFVLVHGAWHGGWCWRHVSDALVKQGHRVFSPTLTGLGERSHLLNKSVNLTTHITDIVNVIQFEDLNNVVLVGHSYGGIIISGVAEQVADRISSIVFLDAFLPEDGETLLQKSSPAFVAAINGAIEKGESGIKPPPAAAFGVAEKDQAWVNGKTTAQPVGTYTEPAVFKGGRDRIATKTYVRAKGYKSATFDANLAKVKDSGKWKTLELDIGHDVMVIDPAQVTSIILGAA